MKLIVFLSAVLISLTACTSSIDYNTGIEVKTEPKVEDVELEPVYPVSIDALIEHEFEGSNLKLEEILAENANYIRYRISYVSDGLKLSGIMNIPRGDGPFPLLILNHGYIDPAIYTNGRGLKREQNYFANNGFAVLHPDYRNHAFSDKDESSDTNFRLDYTKDVIGSILAVQSSTLPELNVIDTQKIGMLGHSMGGGVTQNVLVAKPDLIDAAVLYAPVSSDAIQNLEEYFLKNPDRLDRVQKIYELHGSPDDNPDFWENISPKNFFDRVTVPVRICIGTSDDSTPLQWSKDINEQLTNLNKDVSITIYEDEEHEFIVQWQNFMDSSAAFFSDKLTESQL